MKPRILITIGDINGIGPEIILKTLKNRQFVMKYDLTVLSPFSVLDYYAKRTGIKLYADYFNIIPVADDFAAVNIGKITKESGFVSGAAIMEAIDLCMVGEYDAVVTAPISKEALNLGGFKFAGHTEMLTEISGAKDSCMVMLSDKINIGFASTHPPLKKAASLITKERITSKLEICYNTAKHDLGIAKPKIGVLGLNPHAGDGGVIGTEEIDVINPVTKSLNKKHGGSYFSSPQSPDAYFANGKYKKFNLTFAMYHDQGFIPFKMLAGLAGVNFTAGLKFIRTSPDHGTAFDIAGKNTASPLSLMEAIRAADRLCRARVKKSEKKVS